MNILHLTPWKEKCGIADYAGDLVSALTLAGARNEVHAWNSRGRRFLLAEEVLADLEHFCDRAESCDLVHIQHEFSFFCDHSQQIQRSIDHFGALLARLHRMGKPVAVTFHTDPNFPRARSHLLKGLRGAGEFYRCFRTNWSWRRGVCPHFRGRGRFAAFVHTAKGRAALVESGFDSSHVHKVAIGLTPRAVRPRHISQAQAKKELGYPADAVVLTLFGFVAEYKGHDLATSALRRLPPHFHLAIVGGPHPMAAGEATLNKVLKLEAEHAELKDRVRVTGYLRPETIELYCAATDVCLAPYRNFTQSASAAIGWALTSGRPIIASKVPAFVEMEDEAECLLLIAENAVHELAWQIQRLTADQPLRDRLVGNATAYAERHRWANVAEDVLAVYSSLTGKPVPNEGPRLRLVRAA